MNLFIKTVIPNKTKSLFLLATIAVLQVSQPANAILTSPTHPYYGQELYVELKADRIRNEEILDMLKRVLRSGHMANKGQFDQIVDSCQGKGGSCYGHNILGYGRARVEIFGNLYLEQHDGVYAVKEKYCNLELTSDRLRGIGPKQVPDNTVVNVEHTWPQSKFTGKFSQEMQKSDLHHLFPTDSKANSVRGSFNFGDVSADKQGALKCSSSRFGRSANGQGWIFEPPPEHKGNVARAIFYFATRYDLTINGNEEAFLRKWHHDDPVTQEDRDKNDQIYQMQGNRNPYIDHPELVEQISNF
jgi:deoxyribonuclease I